MDLVLRPSPYVEAHRPVTSCLSRAGTNSRASLRACRGAASSLTQHQAADSLFWSVPGAAYSEISWSDEELVPSTVTRLGGEVVHIVLVQRVEICAPNTVWTETLHAITVLTF